MGLLDRKNTQTTVSVRMSLQSELLRYAELLKRTPSTLMNDIVEDGFHAVRADEPERSSVTLGLIRQALGKDADRKLNEEYYGKVFGIESHNSDRAIAFARRNASRAVPILKEAKQKKMVYEMVRPQLFGPHESDITEEIGSLYDTELMLKAAQEIYNPSIDGAQNFFSVMVNTTEIYTKVYNTYLKDHLAREVLRDVPPKFLRTP